MLYPIEHVEVVLNELGDVGLTIAFIIMPTYRAEKHLFRNFKIIVLLLN